MWNVLKRENYLSALAAATCAVVMLTASPVSAEPPTRDTAAAAMQAYRTQLLENCNFDEAKGKFKGTCAAGVAAILREERRAALESKKQCMDTGGSPKECQDAVYEHWTALGS